MEYRATDSDQAVAPNPIALTHSLESYVKVTIKDLPRNEKMDSSHMATIQGGGYNLNFGGDDGTGHHED